MSLANCFVDTNDGNVQDMIDILESSDIPKSEYIKGNPVYTFSDDSYIMFHNKNMYTVANITGDFFADWDIEGELHYKEEDDEG